MTRSNAGADEGRYNVRAGASAYAPIIGGFGALAVPAIAIVFAGVKPTHSYASTDIPLATGLLVIGMFGSLLGSLGLAAIGAEREDTANLAGAIMLIAIPVSVSVASILAAFEVLADLYAPDSRTLFALILVAGGMFGVLFTSFAISDSVALGPRDPEVHKEWLTRQWLNSTTKSYRWAYRISLGMQGPVVAAAVVRIFEVRVAITKAGVDWLVGSGVIITLAGTALSLLSTAHLPGKEQRALGKTVAFGAPLVIGLYVLTLELFLP